MKTKDAVQLMYIFMTLCVVFALGIALLGVRGSNAYIKVICLSAAAMLGFGALVIGVAIKQMRAVEGQLQQIYAKAIEQARFHSFQLFSVKLGDTLNLPELILPAHTPADSLDQHGVVRHLKDMGGVEEVRIVYSKAQTPPELLNNALIAFVDSHNGVIFGLKAQTKGIQVQQHIMAELTRQFGEPAKVNPVDEDAAQPFIASWSTDDVEISFNNVGGETPGYGILTLRLQGSPLPLHALSSL